MSSFIKLTCLIFALSCYSLSANANLLIEFNLSQQITRTQGSAVLLSQAIHFYGHENTSSPLRQWVSTTIVPESYLSDMILSKDEAHEILSNTHLTDDMEIVVYGDKALIKNISGQFIDAEQIKSIASQYLQDELNKNLSDVSLVCISNIKQIDFYGRNVKFEPRWSKKQLPSAREKVVVDVVSENGSRKSAVLWFSVAAQKDVLMANQNVPAHTRLNKSQFTVVSKNITELYSFPVAINNISDRDLSNGSIRSGAILTENDVLKAPDVVNGEIVQVESRAGDVRISVPAMAAADGAIGEKILVRSLSTHELFYGLVSGEKSIVVGVNNEDI